MLVNVTHGDKDAKKNLTNLRSITTIGAIFSSHVDTLYIDDLSPEVNLILNSTVNQYHANCTC